MSDCLFLYIHCTVTFIKKTKSLAKFNKKIHWGNACVIVTGKKISSQGWNGKPGFILRGGGGVVRATGSSPSSMIDAGEVLPCLRISLYRLLVRIENRMNRVHFVIYGHERCFSSSQDCTSLNVLSQWLPKPLWLRFWHFPRWNLRMD